MLDSKSHTIENNFRRNKEKNLVRFADNWNDGTMELWNDGLGILQCWVKGNNRLDDKIRNG